MKAGAWAVVGEVPQVWVSHHRRQGHQGSRGAREEGEGGVELACGAGPVCLSGDS